MQSEEISTVFFMESDKIENIYLSRKSEGYSEIVVLEREGFSDNLRRNNSVGGTACETVDCDSVGSYGMLRISESEGGRQLDNGLYRQRCEVFRDLTADFFVGGKL